MLKLTVDEFAKRLKLYNLLCKAAAKKSKEDKKMTSPVSREKITVH